jgi:hypothetical protein
VSTRRSSARVGFRPPRETDSRLDEGSPRSAVAVPRRSAYLVGRRVVRHRLRRNATFRETVVVSPNSHSTHHRLGQASEADGPNPRENDVHSDKPDTPKTEDMSERGQVAQTRRFLARENAAATSRRTKVLGIQAFDLRSYRRAYPHSRSRVHGRFASLSIIARWINCLGRCVKRCSVVVSPDQKRSITG